MQQIADWLEKLGMSEYARCFAENDIDLTILPELTDQDLARGAGCDGRGLWRRAEHRGQGAGLDARS
jgi:hypothetical protein